MRGNFHKRDGRTSGSIFIIVLWALLLLGALALALAAYVHPLLRVTLRYQHNTERFFIAKAGAIKTAVEMQQYASNSWQALNEPWAQASNLSREIPLGAGSFTRQGEGGDSGSGWRGLTDEERKLNLNSASAGILQNCLVIAGRLSSSKAADLAAAIIDWRDADDAEMPGGAESRYYEFLTPPYRCKNGNFETMEELALVKGVTPELGARMADYFTVYGRGKVNINTAGEEVLTSLGMSAGLADKILQFRKGADGRAGTGDDGIFKSSAQISDFLSLEKDLPAKQRQQLLDWLDVRSEYFSGRALGRLTGKPGATAIDFVVDCRKRFWYWREH